MSVLFTQLKLLSQEEALRVRKDKQEKIIQDLLENLSSLEKRMSRRIVKYNQQILTINTFPKKSPFHSQEQERITETELSNEKKGIEYNKQYAKKILKQIKQCITCLHEISKSKPHSINEEQYYCLSNFSVSRHNLAASYHQDSKLACLIDNFLEIMSDENQKEESQNSSRMEVEVQPTHVLQSVKKQLPIKNQLPAKDKPITKDKPPVNVIFTISKPENIAGKDRSSKKRKLETRDKK